MDWINRNIDHPMLGGAAEALRVWHVYSRQTPDQLEPVWSIVVLSGLLIASNHFLDGRALVLGVATLVMLAMPSVGKLISASRHGNRDYGAREYKALRAKAISNREAQWTLRLVVLFAAGCLPFLAHISDPTGAAFTIGASLWFVLTAPAKFYLDAAEPPIPEDGDHLHSRGLQFR